MIYHHSQLKCFISANNFTHKVYDVAVHFPKMEMFGTTIQLRRAALSVPLNIVEGNAKRNVSNKEFIRFLKIAFG